MFIGSIPIMVYPFIVPTSPPPPNMNYTDRSLVDYTDRSAVDYTAR